MNIYYNPAVAFQLEGIHAVQGYNEWPYDLDLQDYGAYTGRSFALGTKYRIRLGGGVRYTHLKLDTNIERSIFLPGGTGRSLFDKDYYLTLTAGGGISTKWIDAGIGFSAKPTNTADEWIWAYDMGILALFNLPEVAGIRFIPTGGISYLNFNESVEFYDRVAYLRDEVRWGAGLRIESPASTSFERHLGIERPAVALSLLYEYRNCKYDNSKNGDNYGVELTLLDAFSMRVGHSDLVYASNETTYGMGFGWWFRIVRVQFDVASFPVDNFLVDARETSYGVSIIADL
jgi:hypothetical protein